MKHTDLRQLVENLKHLNRPSAMLSVDAMEGLLDEWDRIMDLVDDPE